MDFWKGVTLFQGDIIMGEPSALRRPGSSKAPTLEKLLGRSEQASASSGKEEKLGSEELALFDCFDFDLEWWRWWWCPWPWLLSNILILDL